MEELTKINNKKRKEDFDISPKELLIMQDVFTDNNMNGLNNYINFSGNSVN